MTVQNTALEEDKLMECVAHEYHVSNGYAAAIIRVNNVLIYTRQLLLSFSSST